MERKLALWSGEQASHVLGIMLDSIYLSSHLSTIAKRSRYHLHFDGKIVALIGLLSLCPLVSM